MRFDLPEGQWIDIYDPRKMPERKRREIARAKMAMAKVPGMLAATASLTDPVQAMQMSEQEQLRIMIDNGVDPTLADDVTRDYKDAVILAYTREWSFGDVSVDVLMDMPGEQYDAIDEAVGKVATATGGPDLNTEVSPEPDSPTSP